MSGWRGRLLVQVTFEVKSPEDGVALIDALNEFGRVPAIDELLARTTDTPTGEPEGAWTIETEGFEA